MGGMIPYFAGKIDLGFRQIFFGTPDAIRRPRSAGLKRPPSTITRCSTPTPRSTARSRRRAAAMPSSAPSKCLFATDAPFDAEQGRGLIANTIARRQGAGDSASRARADLRRQCPRSLLLKLYGGQRHANREHQGQAARRRDGRLSRLSGPDAGRRDHRHHGNLGRQRHHAPSRPRVRRSGLRLPGAGPVLAAGAGRRTVRRQSRGRAEGVRSLLRVRLRPRRPRHGGHLALPGRLCRSATARSARSATASAASSAT